MKLWSKGKLQLESFCNIGHFECVGDAAAGPSLPHLFHTAKLIILSGGDPHKKTLF